MYDIFEKLLNEHGVTAYRVAKETGISTATLTQWKNGTSTPKLDKLQKIADYFGVTVSFLMGEERSITPTIEFDTDEEALEFLNSLSFLEKMNIEGLKAANKYLSYLTSFPEYTEDNKELSLMAAHERTDIEITKEGIDHDNAIMDDEEFWSK